MFFYFLGLLLLVGGCQSNSYLLEPQIVPRVLPGDVSAVPSAFPTLVAEEIVEDWSKELRIGEMFARELDYYRAIGTFKRALVLVPAHRQQRRMQMEYDIVQCYFLAAKYGEAIAFFDQSSLYRASPAFPAFGDLLLMLYESYRQLGQEKTAAQLLEVIENGNKDMGEKLLLVGAVQRADIAWLKTQAQGDVALAHISHTFPGNLHTLSTDFDPLTGEAVLHKHSPRLSEGQSPSTERHFSARECEKCGLAAFVDSYTLQQKSVRKAQLLNAILPGAGYAYVGQKKSALTSFLINTLFIAATWRLAQRGHIAAACITGGLEMGWYGGGINGAGLAAKEHNKVVYEALAHAYMRKQALFPFLMLETRF